MKLPLDIQLNLVCHLKFIKSQKGVDEVIKILELFLVESQNEENVRNAAKELESVSSSTSTAALEATSLLGLCYLHEIGVKKDKEKAQIHLRKAAQQGNVTAQSNLSVCYLNGIFEDKNKKAVNLLTQAERKGYADAQNVLGMCYQLGTGVSQDTERGIELFQKASKQDHPDAQYHLGMYFEQSSQEKVLFRLYKLAIDEGFEDPYIQCCLGRYYQKGYQEINKNEKLAFTFFKKAADQQCPHAQLEMGICYEEGMGVEKDPKRAFECYQIAIKECGNEIWSDELKRRLSNCYREGIGVIKDLKRASELSYYMPTSSSFYNYAAVAHSYNYDSTCIDGISSNMSFYNNNLQKSAKKEVQDNYLKCQKFLQKHAKELYEKAAQQGHIKAKNKLGFCYQKGIGTKEDTKLAVELFEQTIALGSADGCHHLGVCYQEGIGIIEKNPNKAVELYKKALAIDTKHAEALYNLGVCYEHGIGGIEKNPIKAVKIYQEARNHAGAQYNLGLCYQKGIGVVDGKQDPEEAFKLYRRVIYLLDNNHAAAHYSIGICYEKGIGVEKNMERAVNHYKVAAMQEHAGALCNLGICYEEGISVPQDSGHAIKLYEKSAAQKYPKALFRLGSYYEKRTNGNISQRSSSKELNKSRAFKLYTAAAELGYVEAQYKLGCIYQEGWQIETSFISRFNPKKTSIIAEKNPDLSLKYFTLAKDQKHPGALYSVACLEQEPKQAAELFRQAAELNVKEAQCELGIRYETGNGLLLNLELAIANYHKSADQGHAGGQFNLGRCYQEGIGGLPKDTKRAFELFEKAAKQDHPEAQFHLGLCYEKGISVEKNPEQAVQHYEKAAKKKHATAEFHLGRCYLEGEGVGKDRKIAVEFFERSAAQGNVDAYYSLGIYFSKKDIKQAFECFKQAAQLEHLEAQFKLGECYKLGIGTKKDLKRAFELFEKAAKQEHHIAQFHLGDCYENGIGTLKNLERAKEFYEKAAKKGFVYALKELGKFYLEGKQEKDLKYNRFRINLETLDRKKNKELKSIFEHLNIEATENVFAEAKDLLEEVGDIYWLLGKLYMHLYKDRQNAIRAFDLVSNNCNESADAKMCLCILKLPSYVEEGNFDKAFETAKSLVEDYKQEDAYCMLADLLRKKSHFEQAVKAYNAITQSSPYYKKAQAALGYIKLGGTGEHFELSSSSSGSKPMPMSLEDDSDSKSAKEETSSVRQSGDFYLEAVENFLNVRSKMGNPSKAPTSKEERKVQAESLMDCSEEVDQNTIDTAIGLYMNFGEIVPISDKYKGLGTDTKSFIRLLKMLRESQKEIQDHQSVLLGNSRELLFSQTAVATKQNDLSAGAGSGASSSEAVKPADIGKLTGLAGNVHKADQSTEELQQAAGRSSKRSKQ